MERGILSDLHFPLTRSSLWNETPKSSKKTLYLTSEKCLAVKVPIRTLKLAWKYVEKSQVADFRGFFVGTLSYSEDGGLVVDLARFDPGKGVREKKQPTVCAPRDFIIPVRFCVSDEEQGGIFSGSDYVTGIQKLHKSLGESKPASKFFVHAALLATQPSQCLLHCEAVMLSISVEATEIAPIPILPTALARALTTPFDCLQNMGLMQSGYLTMDQTRKLLLILETDPKAKSLPLVGIWLSGVDTISHPLVWSACMSFTHNSKLSERVLTPSGLFVVLLYPSRDSAQPEFWGCQIKREPVWACAQECQKTVNFDNDQNEFITMELLPEVDSPSLTEALKYAEKEPLLEDRHEENATLLQPVPLPQRTVNPYSTLLVLPKPAVPDVSFCAESQVSFQRPPPSERKPLMVISNRQGGSCPEPDEAAAKATEGLQETLDTSLYSKPTDTENESEVLKILRSQKEQLESLQSQLHTLLCERKEMSKGGVQESVEDVCAINSERQQSFAVDSHSSSSDLIDRETSLVFDSSGDFHGYSEFGQRRTSTSDEMFEALKTPELGESASQACLPFQNSADLEEKSPTNEENFYQDVLRKLSDVLGEVEEAKQEGEEVLKEDKATREAPNKEEAEEMSKPPQQYLAAEATRDEGAVIETIFGTYSKRSNPDASLLSSFIGSRSVLDALSSVNETLDETAQLADAISLRYLAGVDSSDVAQMFVRHQMKARRPVGHSVMDVALEEKGELELSRDSKEYWRKYGLFSGIGQSSCSSSLKGGSSVAEVLSDRSALELQERNILDVKKLKELPKLL